MILITGVPRSGTTPLGFMFENFLRKSVVHEPFNYHTGLCEVNSYFEYRSSIFGGRDANKILYLLARLDNKTALFKPGFFNKDSLLKKVAKIVLGTKTKKSYSNISGELIVKDPFLSLSLLECSNSFRKVFVTIRPPSGIINSFIRYKWIFPEVYPDIESEFWLNSKIDFSTDYINDPLFYALYLQYCVFKQLEILSMKNENSVKIIDTSKLDSMSDRFIQDTFEIDNDSSLYNFKELLKKMYAGSDAKKFNPFNFHNHYLGKKSLSQRNSDTEIPSCYKFIFHFVNSEYKKYSACEM